MSGRTVPDISKIFSAFRHAADAYERNLSESEGTNSDGYVKLTCNYTERLIRCAIVSCNTSSGVGPCPQKVPTQKHSYYTAMWCIHFACGASVRTIRRRLAWHGSYCLLLLRESFWYHVGIMLGWTDGWMGGSMPSWIHRWMYGWIHG